MTTAGNKVVVIGGGIVGVSTAIWLQRKGFEVTLVDREGIAAGTSYGNAGVLAASGVVPVSVPGLWKKAPGMLLRPEEPLFLKWSYLPRLLPFLIRFLAKGNDRDVRHIASGLADLMGDTYDQHHALAKGTPAEKFLKPADYVFVYDDRKAYEKDAYGWNLRRDHGFHFEELEGNAIGDYDPVLGDKFGFAVRCGDHGQITDPGAYTSALGEHFRAEGGTIEIAEVLDFIIREDKAVALVTNSGEIEADQIVLASGIWSRKLAEQLGLKVPMESERGYHIEFVGANVSLRSPVMVASRKIAMNSMEGRLRCAGIVEFGGLDAPPSQAPLDLLKKNAREVFPELEYESTNVWMGHRPSTSDSLPLIGVLSHIPNVWTGFGHQHLGLTGAPKTGRWLAQMMAGENPNIDMARYSPDRF